MNHEEMSLPRLVITNMDHGKEMLKSGDLQKQSSVHNIHFIYYSNDCPTINCGKQAQPEHSQEIWIAIFSIFLSSNVVYEQFTQNKDH